MARDRSPRTRASSPRRAHHRACSSLKRFSGTSIRIEECTHHFQSADARPHPSDELLHHRLLCLPAEHRSATPAYGSRHLKAPRARPPLHACHSCEPGEMRASRPPPSESASGGATLVGRRANIQAQVAQDATDDRRRSIERVVAADEAHPILRNSSPHCLITV
jgi:hypothetical protein